MADSPAETVALVIGANIRRLREDAGLTVTALALRADLTKGAVSKIETGQVSSAIATLMRIADALNVELAKLLAEPEIPTPLTVTRRDQGQILTRDGTRFGYAYEALALARSDKAFEPFILTIKPGDPMGEFRHGGQEFIYMLQGSLELTVGVEVVVLNPGDSIYFDPSHQHKTRVRGNKTVRYLNIFSQDHSRPRNATGSTRTRRGRPVRSLSKAVSL